MATDGYSWTIEEVRAGRWAVIAPSGEVHGPYTDQRSAEKAVIGRAEPTSIVRTPQGSTTARELKQHGILGSEFGGL